LIHWLFPHLQEPKVAQIIFGIRKCAHFTEYGILALLFWWALRQPVGRDALHKLGSEAWLALGLVAFYAATDEWHQSFVPSRQASVWDVLIDTSGAASTLLLLWALQRWRRRRKKGKQAEKNLAGSSP
jgi:VanZ family protein